MGTTITMEQNSSAAKAAAENLSARFGDAGVSAEVVAHPAGKKFEFVRIICSPEQWRAVAKHMKNELGVNHCAMMLQVVRSSKQSSDPVGNIQW